MPSTQLSSSTSPMALTHPSSPELKRYTFFVSRQRQDGRAHPMRGADRGADIEDARPRHDGADARPPGSPRVARRHVSRALLVPGMDDAKDGLSRLGVMP